MLRHIKDVIGNIIDRGESENPFYVVDMRNVADRVSEWNELFPGIKPFYAVKCNPDQKLLGFLSQRGINFDCASQTEIQMILDLGVDPKRILYANPCKQISHLRFAMEKGVTLMTADNLDELLKIRSIHPNAEIIIRIAVDDSMSVCRFNKKFGAMPEEWIDIFKCAKELSLNLVGISFHVGSGCRSAQAFFNAVKIAKIAFNMAEIIGFRFKYLDVGGGFPGGGGDIEAISEQLNMAIRTFFPDGCCEVIAEPGRYFACQSFNLVTRIHAIHKTSEGFNYYINDGVYGSFNCIIFDHASPTPEIWEQSEEPVCKYPSRIFGPTCDSMDCVCELIYLPKLAVGSHLVFRNMGAYTIAASSSFNGFPRPDTHHVE